MILLSFALMLITGLSSIETPMSLGYYPLYTDPLTYQPNWESLTHICYAAWEPFTDGRIDIPSDTSHIKAVENQTHEHGKKFILSISSGNQATIDSILANHQQDFVNNTSKLMEIYKADGINIDFEYPEPTNSITHTSNTILFEELMKKLSHSIKTANSNAEISNTLSSAIPDAYRNSNLSEYTDYNFIMGYDYIYWGYGHSYPGSPYNDPNRYDIVDTLSIALKYYPADKLILGIPFYAYDVPFDSPLPGANRIGSDYQVLKMSEAIANAQKYGRIWDSNSSSPYYVYKDSSNSYIYHQVWYEDEESIEIKYKYTESAGLAGIGFWALGWEGQEKEIWKLLDQNVSTPLLIS